jgi:ligand-binding SRPBCC domain-containing protein
MGRSRESAVAGVTAGLIGLGQRVTWRARHFGIWLEVTSEIVQFERPVHFRDSMVAGIFESFDHDHDFETSDGGTIMRDVFDFTSPLGPLGSLADLLLVERYMRGLLKERNSFIKVTAEGDDWRRYLPGSGGDEASERKANLTPR